MPLIFFGIIFIAKFVFKILCFTKYTLPKEPCPNNFIFLYSFNIFFVPPDVNIFVSIAIFTPLYIFDVIKIASGTSKVVSYFFITV